MMFEGPLALTCLSVAAFWSFYERGCYVIDTALSFSQPTFEHSLSSKEGRRSYVESVVSLAPCLSYTTIIKFHGLNTVLYRYFIINQRITFVVVSSG